MIPGIEVHFQVIAQSIVTAINEPWSAARFEAIFYAEMVLFEGEYIREDGKLKAFQPTNEGTQAFRDLRKVFEEAGKKLWGRASMDMHSNGSFKMNWDYENCNERGDRIFSEEDVLQRMQARRG